MPREEEQRKGGSNTWLGRGGEGTDRRAKEGQEGAKEGGRGAERDREEAKLPTEEISALV